MIKDALIFALFRIILFIERRYYSIRDIIYERRYKRARRALETRQRSGSPEDAKTYRLQTRVERLLRLREEASITRRLVVDEWYWFVSPGGFFG